MDAEGLTRERLDEKMLENEATTIKAHFLLKNKKIL